MGRAGIVILPEFLAAVTPHWPDGLAPWSERKPGRKNRSIREVLGAALNGSEWGAATPSCLPPDHSTPWCLKIAALRDFDPANDRSGSIAPNARRVLQHECRCSPEATVTTKVRRVVKGHVWTAPSWRGLSSRVQYWSVRPCVRPLSAVHVTAGHNALRGSGPGQKLAFDNALALVGCPDRRIDRLCITCCSPSQPSHHAGCPM